MLDVRQLMTQHAFELLVLEQLQDAFGGSDGSMLWVSTGRKCVGRRLRNDVAPRLREARSRR